MSISIRKVVISGFNDLSKITVEDDTLPAPAKDHVQLKVIYSGFGGGDINMSLGIYPLQKKPPLTPGYCLVGRVHQNGIGSSRFQVGQIVAALTVYDAEATFINVPEKYLIPVPDSVDDLKAATAMVLDWSTAYSMVHRSAQVKSGDKVFIHGLSGAVGNAVMKLCLGLGAEVYGTASPRNHDALRGLGVYPYDYRVKHWIAEMQQRGGAQAVFDPLGYESWYESYSILSTGVSSILVGYGGNSAQHDSTNRGNIAMAVAKLLAQNLKFCKRRTAFFYIERNQSTFVPEVETLFRMLADKEIDVSIKTVVELENVPALHAEWKCLPGMGSAIVKIE